MKIIYNDGVDNHPRDHVKITLLKCHSGNFSGILTWHIYIFQNIFWITSTECRTSTSCMACTWTPQTLPCSTRAESEASIRMILRSPGVSFRSTLSSSTCALSTLSQMTVEISAEMTQAHESTHTLVWISAELKKMKRNKTKQIDQISSFMKYLREISELQSCCCVFTLGQHSKPYDLFMIMFSSDKIHSLSQSSSLSFF